MVNISDNVLVHLHCCRNSFTGKLANMYFVLIKVVAVGTEFLVEDIHSMVFNKRL